MKKLLVIAVSSVTLTLSSFAARGQVEGPVRTQALVEVEGKGKPPEQVMVSVEGEKMPAKSWQPLSPTQTQVALLIDDGLRESVGRNLSDLHEFFEGLPAGLEVLVGYMQNGTVAVAQPFTTDHERAAAALRLPSGIPGESASPYFCLSEFVKHWPGAEPQIPNAVQGIAGGNSTAQGKARVVLMITNGVDPYNGSTSPMNQDSPYVDQASTDAQIAGVAVYTLYFTDAGIRGPSANFSGQDYLQQVTEATGGRNLYQGFWNAPNMIPYLKDFTRSLSRTYVVTFDAPAGKGGRSNLVRLKVSAPGAKLRAPEAIQPGNTE